MSVLGNLEPKLVFKYFEEISKIPHGSYNTKGISDYLKKFAEDRDLEVYQDHLNNIIIIKEATEGYENVEPVIIQGHMDMVCDVAPGKEFDFEKDSLELMIQGDYITADGTTLGGDDGIAVAMAMALLDSTDLQHPRLEVVITTDEEVGLIGAEGIDVSMLKGKRFINIDSEDEGVFTVSCAGGVTASINLPMEEETFNGQMVELTVTGLQGGHSGISIGEERGAGNQLMARVLWEIRQRIGMDNLRLVSMTGGTKDNAICHTAVAEIVVSGEDSLKQVDEVAASMDKIFKHELKTTDKDVCVKCKAGQEKAWLCANKESSAKVINFLMNTPQGILHMSKDIEGLIETSLNLGIFYMNTKEMEGSYAVRSAVESRKNYVVAKLESLADVLGAKVSLKGDYPGWEYKSDSLLREQAVALFKEMYGREPKVEAIHAGLECGLFAGKMGPELDCISLGPDMRNVHTSDEVLSISSTQRVWEFLTKLVALK